MRRFYLLILILIVPVVLRNVLITRFGMAGNVMSILPLCIGFGLLFFNICIKARVAKVQAFPLLFILYGFICVLIFPLIGIVDYWNTPLVGIFQLFFPLLLALAIAKYSHGEGYSKAVISFLVCFGVINAIGAVTQFFISPDLFGFISNRVYDGGNDREFTKRAISFLASPQSLSIYLAFCLPLIQYCSLSKVSKYICGIIIFVGGVLTGSKAFFVFLFTYLILSIKFRYTIMLVLSVAVAVFFNQFEKTGIDTFDRVLDIPLKLLNIESYLTFQIWRDFVFYPSSIEQVFFGRGLGVMSTASQTLNNYKILVGSTESYFVQLYFEIGIVGLVLFCSMFFIPAIRLFKKKETKALGAILIALASNMAFTPAFYGFSLSCLFYLFFTVVLKNDISFSKREINTKVIFSK